MIKHSQALAVILALFLCFTLLSACVSHKSDEELIESRINSFLKAYNSGDMDSVLECLDAKTRNKFKTAMEIAQVLVGAVPKAGGILGKISISDLFGIAIGTISDDDILAISDITINMIDDTKATVDVTLTYKAKKSETKENAFFTMVKEDDNWFIKNLESK